ncbi:MAG: hypothetical protein LUD18_08315 [Lachnospiraceae bacterium]|nr:hypothetical protein [Lachnospiraceae bacterium]
MKRRYPGLFLAAMVTVSLTGCESVNEVANTVTSTVSEAAGSLTSTVSGKLGLSAETETEMAEGQRKATIQVVSITGNELTYIEETEEETDTESETGTEAETGTEEETRATADEDEMDRAEAENGGQSMTEEMPDANDTGINGFSDDSDEESETEDISEADGESEIEKEADTEQESEVFASTDGGSGRGGNMQGGQRGGMNMDSSGTGNSDMGSMDLSGLAEAFDSGNVDMSDIADTMNGGDADLSSIADAMESGEIDRSDIADVMSGDMDFSDLAGETEDNSVTVYLQVGVVVYTTTGKEKTFSILQAGDELEVLFETDADGNEVITKMWIVSTGAK